MIDLPIIFSGPMIRGLFDDRKTMTRRLAWGKPIPGRYESDGGPLVPILRKSLWQRVKSGDRLWVRESVCKLDSEDRFDKPFYYKADTVPGSEGDEIRKSYGYKWTPSIHCPRIASRLTLIVTETKIERLQDISSDDCIAEGVGEPVGTELLYGSVTPAWNVRAFASLWTTLHGPGSWEANPELVCMSFRVVKENIDSMKEAA